MTNQRHDQGEDVFKKTFKYYKANKPKPSMAEVISVDDDVFIDSDKVTIPCPSNPTLLNNLNIE